MSRRTLWIIAGLAALVAAVGVTTAVAGSAARNAPSATKATTAKSADPAKAARKSTRSKQASTQDGVTQSPSAGKSAADYWTPERMGDVQGRELTTPGGSPSAAPASPVRSAGAATTTKRTQKSKTRTRSRTASKRTNAAQQDGVTSSGRTTGDATEYWTPEQMAKVTPMGPEAPGGNGSSQGADSGIRSATP